MVDSQARSIDEVLEHARRRLHRLDPAAAQSAMRDGAILVDTRPQAQRQAQGSVPGALLVERNVLEWRFDPRSDARLPEATGYDVRLIIMCSEGYSLQPGRRFATGPRPAERDRPGRRLRGLGQGRPARTSG